MGGEERTQYAGIVGGAPAMLELFELIERVAPSDSTILIQGEHGTGKELVARAIHDQSRRRDQPFVVANCSAFNDNLLDSELFGHKRGAFTGAIADAAGVFETANTGTFFLDEIGDMSPALQVKVLRVLQEGTFHRVGDPEARKVDVRIIAATNRDLSTMVADGTFREDLFYRVAVITITLPPLRDRAGDLPLLVEAFLARHRRGTRPLSLEPACLQRLFEYSWPGNVRELENEIERLTVLTDGATISEARLSHRIRDFAPESPAADRHSLPAAVEALERQMIGAALRRHRGNKTRAAHELGVSRRNLIRLARKYEFE